MHYIIVSLIILVIIGFQIYSYTKTNTQINKYVNIFPKNVDDYKITTENVLISSEDPSHQVEEDCLISEENDVEISQLEVKYSSSTMQSITSAINKYLQKNKGAASDFHLIKDVVERYCGAEEEQITTQQPIPLYLGLMGTMVGIIVGIGAIAITGGLQGSSMMSHISELMTCVAVAMTASLVGVLCTTLIAWRSKDAVSNVEADKNRFYSWIQTELLPVLSGDATNAIYLLQQNLMLFNQTFKSNVTGLDVALSKIGESSREQIELIELIRDIDIKQVAQANINVLKELKDCTKEMTTFNQYLHKVSGYLNAVNDLNNNINEHLNRTAAIERMGAFFESEISQVSAREQYINQVVANVDDTLKKTFESLLAKTTTEVNELRSQSAHEFEVIKDAFEAQIEAFQGSLHNQQEIMTSLLKQREEEFTAYLKEQEAELSDKASVITSMAKEIQTLAETKTAMNELVASTKEQNKKLDNLLDAIAVLGVGNRVNTNSAVTKDVVSTLIKWGAMICIVLIICAFVMYTYTFVTDIKVNSSTAEPDVFKAPISNIYVIETATTTDTLSHLIV